MGLEVWFKEDIRNALLAINLASGDAAAFANAPDDTDGLRAYRAGFKAALTAVALAFGIALSDGRAPTDDGRQWSVVGGRLLDER